VRGPFQHPAGMPALFDQNQPDYATQVAKALSLQTRVPGHLDPRVQLGINIDDFRAPEFQYLRRMNRWASLQSVAAVAGQRSSVQLTLPALPSNVLVIIDAITVLNFNAAPSSWKYGWKQIEAGVPSTYAARDLRLGGTANPACNFGRMTSAAPANIRAGGEGLLGISSSTRIELGWVFLTPGEVGSGECFGVVNDSVNQTLDVNIEWTERVALPSEE